jgi:iron(III) transport system substrate-binding protein
VSLASLLLAVTCAVSIVACSPGSAGGNTVTVYSGRLESLVGPLLDRFAQESGVDLRVRYGDTAEMAAAILEEGANSPADVFFAQDAGTLGALGQRDMLATIPNDTLNRVEPRFRSPAGKWVGVSGRARVIAYNTDVLQESDLPDSVLGFTDPKWRGRLGWAPPNASFQAFITGFRVTAGEDATRSWIEGIKANNPRSYPNNIALVHAIARGEIHAGFTNHYYRHAIEKDQGSIPVRNYHPRDAGIGAMINVAGVGILSTSKNQDGARRFVEFLLRPESQKYFTTETSEYPLVAGVEPPAGATPLAQIRTPNVDLSSLTDLQGTLNLLRQTGLLL